MRMTTVALILVCCTTPIAPAQETKAKPQPEPAQANQVVRNQDAPARELRGMVRAYMIAELHFARAACGLSKVEYKAVGKDAMARCDRLAKDLLPAFMARAKPDPKDPLPTAAIEAALAEAVKARATPAQWAMYQTEVKLRRDDRRDSAVDLVLFTMDHQLLLSARQRESIRHGLVDHWNPAWYDALLERNPVESEWMVKIPDDLVTPDLSPTQRQTWAKRVTLVVDPFTPLDQARKTSRIAGPDPDLGPNPAPIKQAKP